MTKFTDEWGEWETHSGGSATVKNLIKPSAKWLAKQAEIPPIPPVEDPIKKLRKELRDIGVMVNL